MSQMMSNEPTATGREAEFTIEPTDVVVRDLLRELPIVITSRGIVTSGAPAPKFKRTKKPTLPSAPGRVMVSEAEADWVKDPYTGHSFRKVGDRVFSALIMPVPGEVNGVNAWLTCPMLRVYEMGSGGGFGADMKRVASVPVFDSGQGMVAAA